MPAQLISEYDYIGIQDLVSYYGGSEKVEQSMENLMHQAELEACELYIINAAKQAIETKAAEIREQYGFDDFHVDADKMLDSATRDFSVTHAANKARLIGNLARSFDNQWDFKDFMNELNAIDARSTRVNHKPANEALADRISLISDIKLHGAAIEANAEPPAPYSYTPGVSY